METDSIKIPSIDNDGCGESRFGFTEIALSGSIDWRLSEQQAALNFRHRRSSSHYRSDWHVAGDPTLLIVLQGKIEIELRNGQVKTFKSGDMFIAQDYLADPNLFTDQTGHRARVRGKEELHALHIKLSKR